MTENELDVVNNVAQKLEIYMLQKNLTIFSIAKNMNIDRQPFYRILNRKNVPTISSLFIIATNLQCSVQELISKYIFIDIPVYMNLNFSEVATTYRIYTSYEEYQRIKTYLLFGVKLQDRIKIYLSVDNFINDGIYIVDYESQKTEIEILSAGSKLIIANVNGREERMDNQQIKPIAKYYSSVVIVEQAFSRELKSESSLPL